MLPHETYNTDSFKLIIYEKSMDYLGTTFSGNLYIYNHLSIPLDCQRKNINEFNNPESFNYHRVLY